MNVTFAQKFAKTKLTTTILLCSTLAMTQVLIGCTNKDDKKTNKKSDTTSQTDKHTPFDCASPSAMTGIQQYITKQIAQQANSTVQQLGQQAHINVQNVSMDSILAQLMVNVQNVKAVSGQADQCQGKVSVTIPASDIANANQMATSLNQPTLAQRLSSKGLTLENNTIIADNATFKLPSNGGSYQVNSPSADTIISEVSNVMANSQLKQMMIQNAPTANSNAATSTATTTTTTNTATVSNGAVATGVAVAGAAGAAAVVHHVKKRSNSHATSTHHNTPKKAITKKKSDKESDDSQSTTKPKKNNETTSTKPVTDHSAKTVTAKTTTEKTTTPSKVTTTKTTEKTVTKPQAVPNDSTKLTIVERNEKY